MNIKAVCALLYAPYMWGTQRADASSRIMYLSQSADCKKNRVVIAHDNKRNAG